MFFLNWLKSFVTLVGEIFICYDKKVKTRFFYSEGGRFNIFQTLYVMGLILVILYLFMGTDDFIWDIVTLIKRSHYRNQRLDLHKLDSVPPKLLAVMIAAWREDNVLGHVIDNIIESVHYPKSMYHIFLGIYPNDGPTLAVAEALAEKYPNVHVVINCKSGPTSKAQNINHIITQIKQFEQEHRWRFASLTIHDSEDVVHPYEFKVTNYLLDTHATLQFPVFPLMQMPKFGNFFKNITTGTYADEFAENHFTTMVSRYNAGAFVPSAGTGFVLSRETLEIFGEEDVLPKDSLTEDYRLSLTLFEKGIRMYYVLERVPRLSQDEKLKWDYIATRAMFPSTFKTAVKQKTRWILGITMQSFKFKDIFKTKGLALVGRYSLYKDLKAKVGNLLALLGYPVLLYFFISLFTSLEPIYPMYSLSWYLGLVVTLMMVERQIFRSVAIYNVYGMRSVFFACLFPPFLPFRFIWGNIINFVATINAYKQSIFGNQGKKRKQSKSAQIPAVSFKRKKQLAWDKTDHSFLEKKILKRYHRKLGDILLEKGYVTPEELQTALGNAARKKQTIGSYLLQRNIITEQQLLTALSHVKHIQYIDMPDLNEYNLSQFASFFDSELLHKLLVIPLLRTETAFVIAFCDNSPINAQTILRNTYGIHIHAVFTSRHTIEKALAAMYSPSAADSGFPSVISALHSEGRINYEQVIIARNYKTTANTGEIDTLIYMGLLPGGSEMAVAETEELF